MEAKQEAAVKQDESKEVERSRRLKLSKLKGKELSSTTNTRVILSLGFI